MYITCSKLQVRKKHVAGLKKIPVPVLKNKVCRDHHIFKADIFKANFLAQQRQHVRDR